MIPRWQIRVVVDDGEFVVTTNGWVWQMWEQHFSTKLSRLSDGVGITDLAFLAYQSAKAAGRDIPEKFDVWRRKIVDLELVNQDAERPTNAVPSAD